jgi:hypothetical protein
VKRFSILAFLFLAANAWAQFTTVSGTVTDPNGLPYANGTISAVLVSSGSPKFTATNQPYTPPSQPVGLSPAGSFVMQLADVTALTPGGSTYNFTVSCAAGCVPVSGGKGPVTFTVTGVTISGASQSITATLTAAAPALSFSTPSIPGGSNTQLQFNNSNLFSGTIGLTWNSATGTLTTSQINTLGAGAGDQAAISVTNTAQPSSGQTVGQKTQGISAQANANSANETYETNALATHSTNAGSGLVDILVGLDVFANANIGGGTVTNNYGIVIENMGTFASSKNIGLDIRSMTGVNTFPMFVEGGLATFLGGLQFGGSLGNGPELTALAGLPTATQPSGPGSSIYSDTNTGYPYTFTRGQWEKLQPASPTFILTDASPIAWDTSQNQNFDSVTLAHTTATRALNVTNLDKGGIYYLEVLQDGTGGAALTPGTGCTWLVPGGTSSGSFNVTTTANARDLLRFVYDGTRCLAEVLKNFGAP